MESVKDSNEPGATTPLVSVVIPAFNEGKHIGKVLEALIRQTLPRDQFEILVVDNGSTDQTAEIARSFANTLPLRLVSKERGRISMVRNAGAAAARGRVVAFLDGDCVAAPEWLERSLSLAAEAQVWGADYLVPENGTWVGKVWGRHQAKQRLGEVSFIPASNLFMTRQDFTSIGGFNEEIETSEDVELALRARNHGMRVLAFPDLAVVHLGTPRSLAHFYRQNRWHGTHVFRIFFANLPSRKNLPIVLLSLFTLVMFWVTVLAIPAAIILKWPSLFILALALLLAPPLLLATSRAVTARRPTDLPPLFVLYTTYLFGRAASVLQLSKRTHR